jgi:ectoine hydroxylase-related dioxygenase (phytanoyl-CoA dioxygenase family)
MIARIFPSAAERTSGSFADETIKRASRNFRTDGALILEDVVDTAIVAEARRQFAKSYSRYLNGGDYDDALAVGNGRVYLTVDLSPPFDSPQLFANPYLLPILSAALGDDFVIGAYGAVCSLPSAAAQPRHCEGGFLFLRTGVDWLLPPAAVAVAIPLIEMNEIHGTTTLWLGSHRDQKRSNELLDPNGSTDFSDVRIEPVVRDGSCMLWDFRLVHCGTANRGSLPRPMLFLTYCRPWFLDDKNFTAQDNPKQKPLLASTDFVASLPAQQRRLLARAVMG